MPIVEITLFEGRDEETKARIARAVADAVAEETENSISGVHVLFHEMPRGDWSRGLSLASRRPAPTERPQRSDYASISRIKFNPDTEKEYLALRRDVINPGMATQEGFISSLLLRPDDREDEYLLINKWLTRAHADAYTSGGVHDALREQALKILPERLDTTGSEVVHLDPARGGGANGRVVQAPPSGSTASA